MRICLISEKGATRQKIIIALRACAQAPLLRPLIVNVRPLIENVRPFIHMKSYTLFECLDLVKHIINISRDGLILALSNNVKHPY